MTLRRFQSTLPRGERLHIYSHLLRVQHFNPRSREGSDWTVHILYGSSIIISIHAPARGATLCYIRPRFYAHISIHAPARGATVFARDIFKDSEFQSTLPRGERLSLCSSADIHVSFQSTLPRGERRAGMNTAPGCRIFQSTLPRGERQ